MICKDNQVTVACEKFARFSLTIALNHSIPAFEHRQVEQYFQQKVPVGIRARRKKRNLAWLNLRWRIKTLLKYARRRLREKLRIHDIVGSVVILRTFRRFCISPHFNNNSYCKFGKVSFSTCPSNKAPCCNCIF
jgi:hypothetical protein